MGNRGDFPRTLDLPSLVKLYSLGVIKHPGLPLSKESGNSFCSIVYPSFVVMESRIDFRIPTSFLFISRGTIMTTLVSGLNDSSIL